MRRVDSTHHTVLKPGHYTCMSYSFSVCSLNGDFFLLLSFGLLVCYMYISMYIHITTHNLQCTVHVSIVSNSPEQGSLCTVQMYSSSPCVHPYLSSSLAVHTDCMAGDSAGIPPHNGPIENYHEV